MAKKTDSFMDPSHAVRKLASDVSGTIALAANAEGVCKLEMMTEEDARMVAERRGAGVAEKIADQAAAQLEKYFKAGLREFNLPLDLRALTVFQRKVLKETARIPFGSVLTYGEVALRIGKPNSARAVGGALAHNPIAIIIPCHRVVAHDGGLHGFSSPEGLRMKARLLRHEGLQVEGERVKDIDDAMGHGA